MKRYIVLCVILCSMFFYKVVSHGVDVNALNSALILDQASPLTDNHTFLEEIQKKENKIFPEFQHKEWFFPEGSEYMYFAPSKFFRKGLLTLHDIQQLRENSTMKMLSMGSGNAYLERFIVENFGLKKDQIVLSDIDETLSLRQFGFAYKIFDMYGQWPDFKDEGPFDFIIFGECLLINQRFNRDKFAIRPAFVNLIGNALAVLKEGGEIRIYPHNLHDNLPYAASLLLRTYQNIEFTENNNLFTVKKNVCIAQAV